MGIWECPNRRAVDESAELVNEEPMSPIEAVLVTTLTTILMAGIAKLTIKLFYDTRKMMRNIEWRRQMDKAERYNPKLDGTYNEWSNKK